jgi:hypothetical protein
MNSVKVNAALLFLLTFLGSRALSLEKSHFPAQHLSLNGNHILSGIIPSPLNDVNKLLSPENLTDAPSLLQSAQTVKKKLDSLITNNWNLTENKWTAEGNQRYEYDDKGRLIKYILSEIDTSSDNWVDSYNEEYIYESDNLIRYTDSYRDTITGAWIFDNKVEYSYDSNSNPVQYITYEWQLSTGQWIASAKGEYLYNPEGKVIEYTSSYRDTSSGLWVSSYKGEYSYNSGGKPTLYTGYRYGGSPGNWVSDYKGEFSYDTGGRIEQYIDYYWNSSTKQWVEIGKDEFSYDANGFLVRTTEYYYDALTRRYVSERKQEYNYDANSNISQYTEFYFKQTGGGWIYTFKEEYTYNNDYAYDDLVVPVIYNESNRLSFNHMRLSANSFLWDEISGTWKNHKSNSFWYSNFYPEKDVPDAVDDQFFVLNDTILIANVSLNDKASKNDPNSWELLTANGPIRGRLTAWDISTGAFTYEPDSGYVGEDWFYYRLCDGDNDCDTAKVSITVTEVNTPPYIIKNLPGYEVSAGKTLSIFISSTPGELFGDDNTGDSLTITVYPC